MVDLKKRRESKSAPVSLFVLPDHPDLVARDSSANHLAFYWI
jgi:hypothetical protein